MEEGIPTPPEGCVTFVDGVENRNSSKDIQKLVEKWTQNNQQNFVHPSENEISFEFLVKRLLKYSRFKTYEAWTDEYPEAEDESNSLAQELLKFKTASEYLEECITVRSQKISMNKVTFFLTFRTQGSG